LDPKVVDLKQRKIHLYVVLARVKDVAQPVADEVKAKDRE
jgi:hypothetical protein